MVESFKRCLLDAAMVVAVVVPDGKEKKEGRGFVEEDEDSGKGTGIDWDGMMQYARRTEPPAAATATAT